MSNIRGYYSIEKNPELYFSNIENSVRRKRIARAIVSLTETPIKFDTVIDGNDIRLTDGCYYIKYSPINRITGQKRKKAFMIECDLWHDTKTHYYMSWEDFLKGHSWDPVTKWLLRNTPISNTYFLIAMKSLGIRVSFAPDWTKIAAANDWAIGERYAPKEDRADYFLNSNKEYEEAHT